MYVREIMSPNPVTAARTDTLAASLGLMEQVHCHHLPIISEYGHLIGILSGHDCRVALNCSQALPEHWRAHEAEAERIKVNEVMTPAPITAEPTMPICEAARLMYAHHISCLPVMLDEALVGIITVSDLLVALMRIEQAERKQSGWQVTG